MTFAIHVGALAVLVAAASACHRSENGPPTAAGAPAAEPVRRSADELTALSPERFFPERAWNGRCHYARRYRRGERVANYVRQMDADDRRDDPQATYVRPLDLDCFDRSDVPLLEQQRDTYSAYVAFAFRWMSRDPATHRLTPRQTADRLRLEEAQALRFPDPLFFLGSRAEADGNLDCAGELFEDALAMGYGAAWFKPRGFGLSAAGEPTAPGGCVTYFSRG